MALLYKHRHKLMILGLWLALLGGLLASTFARGISMLDALAEIVALIKSPYGLPLLLLLALVRPLAFFSLSLFMLGIGCVFGPLWGFGYALTGCLISASVAYASGYFFGSGTPLNTTSGGLLQQHTDRMRSHSFETILLLHFMFLPFDLINYASGLLHVSYRSFILAVTIGIIPGTFVLVNTGAMMPGDELLAGNFDAITINPWMIALSLAIVVSSITLAYHYRCRRAQTGSLA